MVLLTTFFLFGLSMREIHTLEIGLFDWSLIGSSFEHESVGSWRHLKRRDTSESQIEIVDWRSGLVVGYDVVPVGMGVATQGSKHVVGANREFDCDRTEMDEFKMLLS
jgi:hypothetical protein